MSKITFFSICLCCFFIGYGQQTQYNIGFEPTDNDGTINYWSTFESPNPTARIIDNPDTDNGTVPVTKVLELVVNQNSACYAGAINVHGALGTWQLDPNVASNLTLSVSINSSIPIGRVGVKMVNATNGTLFEISDAQGNYVGANQWQTLTWNITAGANSGDNINVDQIVFFADWRCGGATRPSDVTLLVDNISWGANRLSSPPAPSCTNGVQDGNETGVDCGGSCPNSCIPDPTSSAPQFSSTGTDLYVYSDIVGPSVTNFIFNSFGGAGTYNEIDLESNGNMSGKLFELDFFGSQWDPVDASAYTYVHLDYYALAATTNFEFFLIDDSLSASVCCGNPAEPKYSFGPNGDEPLVNGQWKSAFIPLSHFSNFNGGWDGTDLKQTKFTGNGTVYFDNIYFSTFNTLSLAQLAPNSFKAYPNPTSDSWELNGGDTLITKVEIYDVLGKQMQTIDAHSSTVTITSAGLKAGVYFAKVSTKQGSSTLRLVKK
ncbi:hypothetical protein CW736_12980 [Nonlabens sp. MB-3u-79]|uniref:T9SS type A sorting domain-containing protein n=1 Tax=Nonlabens sp. MB-3u-79 TaxID=2058134 RepID=UPI000C31884D|nr:T9SS type A sorting domain-containing protein [Nonlabens sp. MB-3u-79]AUC80231.1 hypothetical protein CW736_12980 [Nonlabens sp. MB-3u-79]